MFVCVREREGGWGGGVSVCECVVVGRGGARGGGRSAPGVTYEEKQSIETRCIPVNITPYCTVHAHQRQPASGCRGL